MNSSIAFLLRRFEQSTDQTAFVFLGREFTYGWLLNQIEVWRGRLEQENIDGGRIVAVEGDYSPEVCALILALIERNAIVVPLASVTREETMRFAKLADVQNAFVFENGLCVEKTQNEKVIENFLLASFVTRKQPGLIVFSSGSEGTPKAILHDFSLILEKFKVHRKRLRTLSFLQLDHLGGINTLLYSLSNAGTVITIKDRTPKTVCEAIDNYDIELLPVTPSFLNLLIASNEYKRWELSSLKVISYGTEVMPASTLKRVREIFPKVKLQQTYGLSELGVLRTKSKEDGSLWLKVGGEGFDTKVVEGTLWIRAQSAMVGYLNAPQPFDKDGWFNTEDRVEVDGEYIKILGRNSEIINVAGQKVFPSEVESVLLQVGNVKDAIVRGEKNVIVGNIVVATLNLNEPEDPQAVINRVKDVCRVKLSAFKVPQKIEITDARLYGDRLKRVRRPIFQKSVRNAEEQ